MKKPNKQQVLLTSGAAVLTLALIVGCNVLGDHIQQERSRKSAEAAQAAYEASVKENEVDPEVYREMYQIVPEADAAPTAEGDTVTVSEETDGEGNTTVTVDRTWTKSDTEAGNTGGSSPDMGLGERDTLTDESQPSASQNEEKDLTSTGENPVDVSGDTVTTSDGKTITLPEGTVIDDSMRDPNNPPAVSNNPAAQTPPGGSSSSSGSSSNSGGTSSSGGSSSSSGGGTAPSTSGNYDGEISADGKYVWIISKWMPYSSTDGGTGGDLSDMVTGGLSGNKIGKM